MLNMAMKLLILALLPLVIEGRIRVHMRFEAEDEDALTCTVNTSGDARELIDDVDLRHFSISQERLRAGVEALTGSRPDQVFLRDPTANFGNQYQINGWQQTVSVLTPISHNCTRLERRNATHARQIMDNNSEINITNIRIQYDIHSLDVAKNAWSNVPKVKFFNSIFYHYDIVGRLPLQYYGSWGERNRGTRGWLIGTGLSNIFMEPDGRALIVKTGISVLTAEVSVVYESSVQGMAVGFWRSGHNGSQFWAYDVNQVLRAGGMPMTRRSTDFLNLHYSLGGRTYIGHPDDEEKEAVVDIVEKQILN